LIPENKILLLYLKKYLLYSSDYFKWHEK
jgi:hypothetical protein